MRIGLVIHGQELASPGGPSVRVPRLGHELHERGFDVSVGLPSDVDFSQQDLIHVFNVWPPTTALDVIRSVKACGRPLVFSPVFLNLSQFALWSDEVPRVFDDANTSEDLDRALLEIRLRRDAVGLNSPANSEVIPGYHAMIREMVALADHVICLSEFERRCLAAIGADVSRSTLIYNPVDVDVWSAGDPEMFANAYGLRDYALCVARIEPRKNQLLLAQALTGTGIPLVLIGGSDNPDYLSRLSRFVGTGVHVIDRLEPSSPMLTSAMSGAKVFVLPSWAEGAPLAALEAAAAGVPLVLSSSSGEYEYFGDHARYCDPGDVDSIRSAVRAAYDVDRTLNVQSRLDSYILATLSWRRHVDMTIQAYYDTSSLNIA